MVDVTKRYTEDIKQLYPRRNFTTETRLPYHMMRLTKEKRFGITDSLLKELEKRHLNELKELETIPTIDWSLMIGRQSGSLEWRLARGELGK